MQEFQTNCYVIKLCHWIDAGDEDVVSLATPVFLLYSSFSSCHWEEDWRKERSSQSSAAIVSRAYPRFFGFANSWASGVVPPDFEEGMLKKKD